MASCVIKADDFRGLPSERWGRFLDQCEALEVPVAVGVISFKLACDEAVDKGLVAALDQGPYEVFNHGLTHSKDKPAGTTEFCGQSLEAQLQSLEHSQEILADVFGRPSRIFGPPFNSFDANTLRALEMRDEIEIVLDIPYIPGKQTIPKAYYVECEGPFSGRKFALDAAMNRCKTFTAGQYPFVLQIHPGNAWTSDCLRQFTGYLQYLQACGYEFVLPHQLFPARHSIRELKKHNGVVRV